MGSRGSKQGENARLEDVNITNNLDLPLKNPVPKPLLSSNGPVLF
jgi:hypothetical protein